MFCAGRLRRKRRSLFYLLPLSSAVSGSLLRTLSRRSRLKSTKLETEKKLQTNPKLRGRPVELADTGLKNQSNSYYPKLLAIAAVAVILLFSPILHRSKFWGSYSCFTNIDLVCNRFCNWRFRHFKTQTS